ncbi:PEP-CTERM sorting domain-containing protein [Gloeothece verrucosa]|uniref:PEP-CTERM protein-sorting domain-containing protein n=1 Tax=Gloeothece verrucosa (strain PCC 7822) TaxID=497965 RepID=E0UF87_GLOV7|nr:PEP-CTERM sorting domain-containing protein [Gloeothece verrucosa]ADN15458.1 hypothetical protein Cyan7822_3516 [Gloeothece verrucosa PCC 7822]
MKTLIINISVASLSTIFGTINCLAVQAANINLTAKTDKPLILETNLATWTDNIDTIVFNADNWTIRGKLNIPAQTFDFTLLSHIVAPHPENPFNEERFNDTSGVLGVSIDVPRERNKSNTKTFSSKHGNLHQDVWTVTIDTNRGIIGGFPSGGGIQIKAAHVPEPLTLLGVGTALSFGAYFKRQLKKQ